MQLSLRCAGVLIGIGLAVPARAGPTFEQSLERQRASVREETGAPPLPDGPDNDVTLSIGAPGADIPRMQAPEVPRKGPAVRLRHEWLLGDDGETHRPRVRLGLTVGPTGTTTASLQDSSIAWPTGEHAEAYASVESRHWGPAWTSSLILDGAAPAVAAVGWRRPDGGAFESRWLSWLGPWRADVFVGQLEGHTQPAHPYLIGMRFEIEPIDGLQLAASRTIEWGGTGRPEGWKSFYRALAGQDNVDSPDKQNEPGNQLAGFDARYRFDVAADKSLSVYSQAIGEDANRALPTAFLALFGADLSVRSAGLDWRGYVEWSNTIAGDITGRPRYGAAYRHHIYLQGYTTEGRVLGAPIGGDAKLTSVGGIVDVGNVAGSLTLHAGKAGAYAQSYTPGVDLAGADAALSLGLDDRSRAGLSAWVWRAGSDRHTALQLWWQRAWP